MALFSWVPSLTDVSAPSPTLAHFLLATRIRFARIIHTLIVAVTFVNTSETLVAWIWATWPHVVSS